MEANSLSSLHKLNMSGFVSQIKFEGLPILPPVMTESRRNEMRHYQRSAILIETKRRAAVRHKMLARLQSAVHHIDELYGCVPVDGETESIRCLPRDAETSTSVSQPLVSTSDDAETLHDTGHSNFGSLGETNVHEPSVVNSWVPCVSETEHSVCKYGEVVESGLSDVATVVVDDTSELTLDVSPDSGVYSKYTTEMSAISKSLMSDVSQNLNDVSDTLNSLTINSCLLSKLSASCVSGITTDNAWQDVDDNTFEDMTGLSGSIPLADKSEDLTLNKTSTDLECDSSQSFIGINVQPNDSVKIWVTQTNDVMAADQKLSLDGENVSVANDRIAVLDDLEHIAHERTCNDTQVDFDHGSIQECQTPHCYVSNTDSCSDDEDCLEDSAVKTVVAVRVRTVLDQTGVEDSNNYCRVADGTFQTDVSDDVDNCSAFNASKETGDEHCSETLTSETDEDVEHTFDSADGDTKVDTEHFPDVGVGDIHRAADTKPGFGTADDYTTVDSFPNLPARCNGDCLNLEDGDSITDDHAVADTEDCCGGNNFVVVKPPEFDFKSNSSYVRQDVDYIMGELDAKHENDVMLIVNEQSIISDPRVLYEPSDERCDSNASRTATDVTASKLMNYNEHSLSEGSSGDPQNSDSREAVSVEGNSVAKSPHLACSTLHEDNPCQLKRHNSYTLDSPSLALVDSKLPDVNPVDSDCNKSGENEFAARGKSADNNSFQLTASMEELHLKPTRKRLMFNEHPIDLSPSLLIEPPAPYRDDPNELAHQCKPEMSRPSNQQVLVDVSVTQAKMDHLQRYLKSLSTMPALNSPATDQHGEQDGCNSSEQSPANCYNGQTEYVECTGNSLYHELIHQNVHDINDDSEDKLVELQLKQYELMKRKLIEEHQRSLERLLAEQEHQMALLHSRLRGHSHGASVALDEVCPTLPTTSVQQMSDNTANSSGTQKSIARTPRGDHSLSQLNSGSVKSQLVFGLDERLVTPSASRPKSSVADDSPSNAYFAVKQRTIPGVQSPAGVYFAQMPRTSPEPSCSTMHSEDTESEIAYKSPAVLRSCRRLTPVISPRIFADSRDNLNNSHRLALERDRRVARRYINMFTDNIPSDIQEKCAKLSAAVKGYLTRRLFKTEKVQTVIKTIWDTVEFALQFQTDSPIKKGQYTAHDRYLQERVLAQLNSALFEFHEIFFDVSTIERMHYIAQDRAIQQERRYKKPKSSTEADKSRRVSAATLKAIERKKKAVQKACEGQPPKSYNRSLASVYRECGLICSSRQQRKPARSVRISSPKKMTKDGMHRLVVRDKSRAAGNATRAPPVSPVRPRIISRQSKVPKRSSTSSSLVAGAAANSPSVITTRKVARAGSVQSTTPIAQHQVPEGATAGPRVPSVNDSPCTSPSNSDTRITNGALKRLTAPRSDGSTVSVTGHPSGSHDHGVKKQLKSKDLNSNVNCLNGGTGVRGTGSLRIPTQTVNKVNSSKSG